MCIALLSTAHPAYSLILLSNRDEFLSRRTAQAEWWEEPYSHILAGRDLQRTEKGTWLGITKDGRIAVLTNFREEGSEISKEKSRGAIVTAWLQPSTNQAKNIDDFAEHMINDVGIHDVGGFSLIYGYLRQSHPGLAIISNKTTSAGSLLRVAKNVGETRGLSNSHYGDLTWPKVVHGEMMLAQAISSNQSRGDGEEVFIESLFDILSVDTLPKRKAGETTVRYMRQLRNSIFIPPIGGDAMEEKRADTVASSEEREPVTFSEQSVYGTQKQTVVLVDTSGAVTWCERTLDERGLQTEKNERRFHFQIDSWKS